MGLLVAMWVIVDTVRHPERDRMARIARWVVEESDRQWESGNAGLVVWCG